MKSGKMASKAKECITIKAVMRATVVGKERQKMERVNNFSDLLLSQMFCK